MKLKLKTTTHSKQSLRNNTLDCPLPSTGGSHVHLHLQTHLEIHRHKDSHKRPIFNQIF